MLGRELQNLGTQDKFLTNRQCDLEQVFELLAVGKVTGLYQLQGSSSLYLLEFTNLI